MKYRIIIPALALGLAAGCGGGGPAPVHHHVTHSAAAPAPAASPLASSEAGTLCSNINVLLLTGDDKATAEATAGGAMGLSPATVTATVQASCPGE